MNLNELNTPADLLAANSTPATKHDADSVYEIALENLSYTDAVALSIKLVNQLALYHQNTRNELVESGECERATLWAFDEAQLAVCLNILNNITLD